MADGLVNISTSRWRLAASDAQSPGLWAPTPMPGAGAMLLAGQGEPWGGEEGQ